MARKRLTQIFPWLLPLRKKQRRFFFYRKMRRDGHRYAGEQSDKLLPHVHFQSSCPLYNPNTGFAMIYQEHKVFNLKLAAVPLHGLIIHPGETFSLWHRIRGADRDTPYRDALGEVDGHLVVQPGGGLCQISNLLYWLFLHTPLTVTERHGHAVKAFPEPPSDAPMGVDATVSEGWLDLRAQNRTDTSYQITLTFDDQHITGAVRTARNPGVTYQITHGTPLYSRRGGAVFEEVDVQQRVVETTSGACTATRLLYRNRCEIRYPLPGGISIREEKTDETEKRSHTIWRMFARI